MPYYRLYLLTEHDHIDDARDADCTSDDDAQTRAAEIIGDYPAVEIWSGTRLVGRFTADALRSGSG
jgi:hypothetical protein